MNALKDKVTEKLSNLFADAPSSAGPSPPTSQPQPNDSPPTQARSQSRGKYLSSFWSRVNFSGSKSNKCQNDIKPNHSLPGRWRNKDLKYPDAKLDEFADCETAYEMIPEDCDEEEGNKEHDFGRSTTYSDVFEDTISPIRPPISKEKSMPNLKDDSSFISSELYEFLQSSLPNLVKGCQWALLYSTLKHGMSLRTLIRKSADHSGLCLLIAGDKKGAVFGGLIECPLKPTVKRKYQGTIQSFVFTTLCGEPRLFRPTGANRYFYLCLNDLLAIGGGGNFALSLDADLLNGTSGPCETFGNLCLAHSPEFELKNVEDYGCGESVVAAGIGLPAWIPCEACGPYGNCRGQSKDLV